LAQGFQAGLRRSLVVLPCSRVPKRRQARWTEIRRLRVRAGHGLTPRSERTEALAAPRHYESSDLPPRSPTTPLAKGRHQTPRRRNLAVPSPSRSGFAPQRHPFPTGSARRHRSLRRHDDCRPTDRSGIPCRSTALVGRPPLRDRQAAQARASRASGPDLRPTVASSGKDASTGPATWLPKTVRP